MGVLDRIGFLELIPYGAILLVILFLMKLEPHMSGTILILAGAAAVMFAAGIKLYWFLLGGVGVVGLLALSMQGYEGGPTTAEIDGSLTVNRGDVTVPGNDVKAGGVSLQGHAHGGVMPGGGTSGPPVNA